MLGVIFETVPVSSTQNHNFDTTQPQGQQMLLCLGHKEREKAFWFELQNTHHMTYKDILSEPRFREFGVQKEYHTLPLGFARDTLPFSNLCP